MLEHQINYMFGLTCQRRPSGLPSIYLLLSSSVATAWPDANMILRITVTLSYLPYLGRCWSQALCVLTAIMSTKVLTYPPLYSSEPDRGLIALSMSTTGSMRLIILSCCPRPTGAQIVER